MLARIFCASSPFQISATVCRLRLPTLFSSHDGQQRNTSASSVLREISNHLNGREQNSRSPPAVCVCRSKVPSGDFGDLMRLNILAVACLRTDHITRFHCPQTL